MIGRPGTPTDDASNGGKAGRLEASRVEISGRAASGRAASGKANGSQAARPRAAAGRRRAARTRFLLALRELDDAWVAAFHRAGFGDIYFSRLFTELWLRDAAVSKSDAYDLVKGVSLQTAMKYVNKAIADGYLEEIGNPADGRSRLLRMSPLLRERFAQIIDHANAAFLAVLNQDRAD